MDSGWKRFERLTAARISKWLAKGIEGVEAERVICRQALLGRMAESTWGDLAIHPQCSPRMLPAAKWFMDTFMVDCKNRKAFRLPGLLTAPAHPFWGWWRKLDGDAVDAGHKVPLMVVMNQPSKEHLLLFGDGCFFDRLGDPSRSMPVMKLRQVGREEYRINVAVLEDFLEWADPVALGCPKVEGNGNVS